VNLMLLRVTGHADNDPTIHLAPAVRRDLQTFLMCSRECFLIGFL
jgi:hypothetical protein